VTGSPTQRRCDLVLGGGGLRGLAHIGALMALDEQSYAVERVAGASAGAVVGALGVSGVPVERIGELFEELDFRSFAMADVWERLSAKRAIKGIVNRLTTERIEPLTWIRDNLAEQGVETFADLRMPEADAGTRLEDSYRLVVRCLDVVNRRVVRLPWDFPRYGLNPDEQPVAQAVLASMSIPFVYSPVPIGTEGGGLRGILVDGGLTSGFPVSILDRRDGREPRWPTFGIRLLSRVTGSDAMPEGDIATARMVLGALLESSDRLEPTNECDERRTIRVDVSDIRALEFDLGSGQRVIEDGYEAMAAFLADWDGDAYARDCRSD
jgi:NTE family protein